MVLSDRAWLSGCWKKAGVAKMALNFELQGVHVVDEDKTQWIGEQV